MMKFTNLSVGVLNKGSCDLFTAASLPVIMVGCAAFLCTNRTGPRMRLFRFPRDPERRKRWVNMVYHTEGRW